MQQYQIIHEAVIIQQNKEMNEIIGRVFLYLKILYHKSVQILKIVHLMVKLTASRKYGVPTLALKALDQALLLLMKLI